MALTKISGGVVQSDNFSVGVITATNLQIGVTTIHSNLIEAHNINSTGIITANSFGAINGTTASFSGDVSIGGTLTYADVTNIDSVGIITAQSAVSIADSIFHTGDTDTAVRFPAANTFTVETAGSERLRVNSDGRLLVGTNTARVVSTTVSPHLQVEGTTFHQSAISVTRNTDDEYGSYLILGKSRAASDGGNVILQDNDIISEVRFAGSDGNDMANIAAQIRVEVDGTPQTDQMPGAMILSTNSGSTSATERLRIDSSGRLLIGVTTSRSVGTATAHKLQVEAVDATAGVTVTRCAASTAGPYLSFGKSRAASLGDNTVVQDGDSLGMIRFAGADGTDTQNVGASIQAFVDGTPGSNDMPGRIVLSTTADGANTATERLRIAKNGAFGLGGANYGTSGQVIKSNGSSNAPTWQNLYSFMFYGEQDTHHNVAATTWTSIKNLGTRDFSVGDSDIAVFNESNGTLTIGNSGAGYWFLSMGAGIDDIDVSDFIQVVIDKNGSDGSLGNRLSSYSRSWNGSTNDQVVTANVSCIANLSANDVVSFYVYHYCTSTEKTEENRTFAMGYRIG